MDCQLSSVQTVGIRNGCASGYEIPNTTNNGVTASLDYVAIVEYLDIEGTHARPYVRGGAPLAGSIPVHVHESARNMEDA